MSTPPASVPGYHVSYTPPDVPPSQFAWQGQAAAPGQFVPSSQFAPQQGQYQQPNQYAPPSQYQQPSQYAQPAQYAQPGQYAPPGTPPAGPPRYYDPNIVPVGANDVAPAGPELNPAAGMGPPPPIYSQPAAPSAAATGVPSYNPQPPTAAQNVGGPAAAGALPPVDTKPKDPDDEGWDISHLAPEYTWKKIKDSIGWGADQKLAREAYAAAMDLYKAKKFDEAAKQFYIASWRWPESSLEEDALFYLAECYFFSDQYGKCQDAIDNLFKAHDNTRYLDTVIKRLFDIATYWEQLDEKSHQWPTTPNLTDKTRPWFDTVGNAIAAYNTIRLHDPTNPKLADLSVMRIANLHFRRGEWEEAAHHYDIIRRDYPKSPYQKDAHVLCLQARMKIYQGPKYDHTALDKAKEVGDQAIKQFPGKLGPDEQRVRDTLASIHEKLAEREWTMAQFFDSKHQYGAAKFYYRSILQNYPNTQAAEQTRKRVAEIQNEPDNPPEHFGWMTKWFDHER